MMFLKGLAFGFILAATVGPMWVLCFRRTVAAGALTGFVSGMGIAVADGLYGAVAAFGLTAISGFLLRHSFWIGLAGGAFLLYLGVQTLRTHPVEPRADADSYSLVLRHRMGPGLLRGINVVSGPTILGFAAWQLAALLR